MVLADPVGVCHNTNVDNLNNNYDDDACRWIFFSKPKIGKFLNCPFDTYWTVWSIIFTFNSNFDTNVVSYQCDQIWLNFTIVKIF